MGRVGTVATRPLYDLVIRGEGQVGAVLADPVAPEYGRAGSKVGRSDSGRADFPICLTPVAFPKRGQEEFPVSLKGRVRAALAGSLLRTHGIYGLEMPAIVAAVVVR